MSKKRGIALGILAGLLLMGIPLWFLSYPETTFRHNVEPFWVYSSQITGILGFCLFALSFVFAVRSTWIENIFGGLDKVYHLHHMMGKTAFFLLLLHPLFLAFRWIPEDITKALWYFLPMHRRLAIDLGSWAFMGLLILILFTLVIKIPYDKWKITHKFIGIFFILSVFHVFLLNDLMTNNWPLAIYLGAFAFLGTISYLHKTVFHRWLVRKSSYRVEKIEKPTEQVMQITLTPEGLPLKFTPGQFCFFSFKSPGLSSETHPYTMCTVPGSDHITIIVKALGDYTKKLYQTLQPGATALLEGPYGRFDYKNSNKKSQVWIGGGVGIAPFISWAEALQQSEISSNLQVDLYYCVNSQSEAICLHTFEVLENTMPNFQFHLSCTDQQGFLKVTDIPGIKDKEIFICGPKEMRRALLAELRQLKIDQRNIHFEDFDFI